MDPISDLYQTSSSISDIYAQGRPIRLGFRARSTAFMSALKSAMGEITETEGTERTPFRYLTPVTTNDTLLTALVDEALAQEVLTPAEAKEMKDMLAAHAEMRDSPLFSVLQKYMQPYEDITGRSASAENLLVDLQSIEKDRLDVFTQALILAQRAGELSPDQVRQAQGLIGDNERFLSMLKRIRQGVAA